MAEAEPNVFALEEAGSASGGTPAAAPAKTPRKSISQWSDKSLLRCFRMLNVLNGILLIIGGIIVFLAGLVGATFATITVSGYLCFFGLMMVCVELNIANIQPRIRKNCGFLFTFGGRALFILLSATMAFAMDNWLTYIVGGLTAGNAIFNAYAVCVHPAFRKGGSLHGAVDPFKGMSTGEAEVAAYLQRNPDVAMRVGSAAAKTAAAHPELAKQAMTGAATSAASSGPFKGSASGTSDSNPFA